jgi:protoheme IX farnesyltransferase
LGPISLLPWVIGFAGTIYGVTASISGAILIVLAFRLSRSCETDRQAAHRLFIFSISYLFMLFAALLADHSAGSWPLAPSSSRDARTGGGSVTAEVLLRPLATRCSFSGIPTDEV